MKWEKLPKIDELTKNILIEYSPTVSQLLYNRGIKTLEEADSFFKPGNFGNHNDFKDMKKAVDRIIEAINNKNQIVIYGDYDVDGISSSALLYDYLHNYQKAKVKAYIPSRFTDGYGLRKENIDKFIHNGCKLIITVDCGIKDYEVLDNIYKNDKDVDVIVTDHHTPGKNLPNCYALIHPSLGYSYQDLAGVGVTWNLIKALEETKPAGVDPNDFLDLVTLGTICDLMPLNGENRNIVKHGLEKLKTTKRIGLLNLIRESGINFEEISPYHIGYIIGPKLNASGRLASAKDSFKLLTTKDERMAGELASKLNELNIERQNQTQKAVDEAFSSIDFSSNILIATNDDWPIGIIGLVAGRLQDKTAKPTIILTKSNDHYVGSCRSSEKINIINLLDQTKKFLVSYGGHSQAAGLKILEENIPKFKKKLEEILSEDSYKDLFKKSLKIDTTLTPSLYNWETLDELKVFSPFGIKNPSPIFRINKLKVLETTRMGSDKKHIRLKLLSQKYLKQVTAIGFNMGNMLSSLTQESIVDIVGNIEENNWNGQKYLQFMLKDVRIIE